jgi:hypothetical protein
MYLLKYLNSVCVYNTFVVTTYQLHYSIVFLQFELPELVMLVVACVLLTVLVELPFKNIQNILLKRPQNVNK